MDSGRYIHNRLTNALQTLLLFAGMAGLLGLLGWMLFGADAFWWIASAATIGFLFSPVIDPQAILRFHRAQPLTTSHAPDLYHMLSTLSQRAGLTRVPTLFLVPSHALNAFTLGRPDNAAIALTQGLLRNLSARELAGVLAHELSHVTNNDMRVMMFADATSRLTRSLALVGQILLLIQIPLILVGQASLPLLAIALLIMAPTIAGLLQLALSRTREYRADMDAARITGDPLALAQALHKIDQRERGLLARIFMPYGRSVEPSLTRSHPHTRDRIQRLCELKPGACDQPSENRWYGSPSSWNLRLL